MACGEKNVSVVIDGVRLEGPASKVKEMAGDKYPCGAGSRGIYFSGSMGPTSVKVMASQHIKNAMLKNMSSFIKELREEDDILRFIESITDTTFGCGTGGNEEACLDFFVELVYRLTAGEKSFLGY